jgi:hypothetical protein
MRMYDCGRLDSIVNQRSAVSCPVHPPIRNALFGTICAHTAAGAVAGGVLPVRWATPSDKRTAITALNLRYFTSHRSRIIL